MASLPGIRLALGLGDQELEQRLRPALDADPEFVVAAHCLAADQVVHAVESGAIDAVVLAAGLHRLSEAVLVQLEQARVPLVLLSPDPDGPTAAARRGPVLPLQVEPAVLRQAIAGAVRGERWVPRARRLREAPVVAAPREPGPPTDLSILAVAGGAGSPGRTTLAINLATALGAVVPTVLVDLDCSSPSVAAYLNRDPSRNVCTLAHAVREDPRTWGQALQQELQPLHPRSPLGMLLCGLPKRELRASLTPAVMATVLAELARRFRYVVVDLGAELLGIEAAAETHRTALQLAQHVLLVTGSDLVSLWHARIALSQLERHLGLERERISLVINRHDAHFHHGRAEIEWHLGSIAAQVIPQDYAGAQRAVAEQTPLVLNSTSRAARAMLELAERIHQGRVRLPERDVGGVAHKSWTVALAAGAASVLRGGHST